MEVFFCDRCSRRVTEGDLAERRAVRMGVYCFCKECWKIAEIRAVATQSAGNAELVAPGASLQAPHSKTPRSSGPRSSKPLRSRITEQSETGGSSSDAVVTSGAESSPPTQDKGAAKTPERNGAVSRSPHRGLARARPPTPHGRRRTPSPARPHPAVWSDRAPGHAGSRHRRGEKRQIGTLAMLALFIILGMSLGFLVVYVGG